MTRRTLLILSLSLLAAAAAMTIDSTESVAQPVEAKRHDFSTKDCKGRRVKTTAYRGKVLLVMISGDKTRDKVKPISKDFILKFGHNNDVAQLTLVDLRDLSFYERPFADGELAKVQDRTAKRLNRWLREDGQAPIGGLDRKLHIIGDTKGRLLRRFGPYKTSTTVTIVVINKQGDIVGKFKHSQLSLISEAVDAALEE